MLLAHLSQNSGVSKLAFTDKFGDMQGHVSFGLSVEDHYAGIEFPVRVLCSGFLESKGVCQ